eukprot:gene23183-30395_t
MSDLSPIPSPMGSPPSAAVIQHLHNLEKWNNSANSLHSAHGHALHANGDLYEDEPPMHPLAIVALLYGTMFLMIGGQMGLVLWKKRHQKSYERVWVLYSSITIYILRQCMQKKMTTSTPRVVYGFFISVYRISRTIGIIGYVLLVMEMMGAGPLFAMIMPKGTTLILVWYGVYFGVLGRDCAEVATDGMGWTMVGKKDICPHCHEKVDMRELYSDRPWETRNLTWIQMLDGVRYLVVWNPVIFMALSLLFHLFAPHHHAHLDHHNETMLHDDTMLHGSPLASPPALLLASA